MSMLDDIKAAEAAAAQAKKEAALTSRNLLRDAEEAATVALPPALVKVFSVVKAVLGAL